MPQTSLWKARRTRAAWRSAFRTTLKSSTMRVFWIVYSASTIHPLRCRAATQVRRNAPITPTSHPSARRSRLTAGITLTTRTMRHQAVSATPRRAPRTRRACGGCNKHWRRRRPRGNHLGRVSHRCRRRRACPRSRPTRPTHWVRSQGMRAHPRRICSSRPSACAYRRRARRRSPSIHRGTSRRYRPARR